MRSGTCPKCGSTNIFVQQYGGLLDPKIGGRVTEHDEYVCADCGYFEGYVTDKKSLEHVKQTWKRAGKP